MTTSIPSDMPRNLAPYSRRRFIVSGATLAAGTALLATACGSDSEQTLPTTAAPAETTTTTAAATTTTETPAFPRTVDHFGGSIELTEKPSQIMTMRSFYDLDTVLALDVVPTLVGNYPGRQFRSWQIEAGVEEAEMIDMTDGINLERVAAADIDLFISNEIVWTAIQDEIEAVEQIGPVIALPDFDFAQQLTIVGNALGLDTATIQQHIDDVEGALDSFSVTSPPASIGVLNYYGSEVAYATTAKSNTGSLLERIGLPTLTAPEPPADQARKDYVELSLELLVDAMDVDVLYGFEFDGGAEAWDELEANPVFQQIPAVQNGKYFRLTADEATALSAPSVLSAPLALEALSRTLNG